MKCLRALACLAAVFGTATGAWAQYGLSGGPELLRLGPELNDPGLRPANPIRAATGYQMPGDQGYSDRLVRNWEPTPTRGPSVPPPPNPAASQPLTPVPQPSVMSQMLEESTYAGPAPAYAGAGYGGGAGQPCGEPCGPCFQAQWYVSAAGLIMTRDKANCLWTTYETDNNPNQIMRFNDADVDWRGGFEVKVGRRFACGQWAVEADYWRIDGFSGFASASIPGWTVSTPLIVKEIEFGGITGDHYFDGAVTHRIWRRDEFQNVEINLIRSPINACGECSLLDLHWMLGVRWFNFDESLIFGTESVDPAFAFLSDRIQNNLIGAQVGLEAGCRLGYNWRAFVTPKLGLYDNHIQNTFDAYRSDGVHAVPTVASGVPGGFPVTADKDQFAVLAQIDAGLDWQFHPQWRAFAGYRLIAATGIGLADHQFLTYVVDIPEYSRIKSNGNLLLHGGFAGLEFRF